MNLKEVSAVLLVKNAEQTLEQCLLSLKEFGEIIILDNGSTDGTKDVIAKFKQGYDNIFTYESEFIGFGPLKNLAISHAHNDWIFSIDADEVLEAQALQSLQKLDLASNEVISIPRKNLYKGEWIKACGWAPDYVLRVFNRKSVLFNQNLVHEALALNKEHKVIKLDGYILHYAFNSIDNLLDKLQRYSSLWAEQNLHKKVSICSAMTHASWNFIRNYFIKKGLAYGYKGFIISTCNALGAFFKYMKLYELKYAKPNGVSLAITTYNQKDRLSLVLDSVRNLKPLPNEVLIADDGSTADTKELIEKYQQDFPCPLRHIWHEDKGFRLSEIRNKAIKSARYEYIIVVDGDMILSQSFVKDHLQKAQRKQFLQGSRVLLKADLTAKIEEQKKANNSDTAYTMVTTAKSFKAHRIPLLSYMIYKFSYKDKSFFKTNNQIKGIRGCNMSFYRQDAIECGLFSEDFVGWGFEDSDFVARFLFNKGCFRRLKFGGVAYHLYHQEYSRDRADHNYQMYLDRVEKYKQAQ